MPTTLTVADFLSLRMQYKAEQAENEIPAVIEHNFKDGRMVDHYFVVPCWLMKPCRTLAAKSRTSCFCSRANPAHRGRCCCMNLL